MSEQNESMVEKLNNAIGDFFGSLLGESARKVYDDARETAEEVSKWAGTKSLELIDDILERLELSKNENFTKVRDGYKDALAELGLLEEESGKKSLVNLPNPLHKISKSSNYLIIGLIFFFNFIF